MLSHFKELVGWGSSHELRGETIEASKTLLCWEGSMKIDGPPKATFWPYRKSTHSTVCMKERIGKGLPMRKFRGVIHISDKDSQTLKNSNTLPSSISCPVGA